VENVWFQKISILPPQKELEFPGGGGSMRPKNLKKYMKLNWNFQRGGEVLEKIPSVGDVWTFSGNTQLNNKVLYITLLHFRDVRDGNFSMGSTMFFLKTDFSYEKRKLKTECVLHWIAEREGTGLTLSFLLRIFTFNYLH